MKYDLLDAIARLEALDDLKRATAFIQTYAEWMGFTSIAGAKLPGPGEHVSDNLLVLTRPQRWVDHYRERWVDYCWERNHTPRDPTLLEPMRSPGGFSWKDILARPPMAGADLNLIAEVRDFGIVDGFTVPVFGPAGYVAVISYSADYEDIPPDMRRMAKLFGYAAHNRLRELIAQAPPCEPISPREREVLSWIAVGKTDDEIATILNLAVKTVHNYVERAKTKLNAATRTQAVVQALRRGDIFL